MSDAHRILLIGRGPLPTDDVPVLGFSQLRTQCFLDALQRGGHAVRVVALVPESSAQDVPDAWEALVPVVEEGPGWLEHIQALAEGADAIVSAGPYNPGRAACLVAGDQPVWADMPGDPFAELSALALAMDSPLTPERLAAAEAAALPVLARADALSVISTPQRHSTLGALGAVGRLGDAETMPDLHVVPIAHAFGLPMADPRTRAAGDPLVVALSGAFNPWFDDRTLTRGLDLALRQRPNIRVIVTGGGIEGFYTAGYDRFSRWCADGPWGDRIEQAGWIPHGQIPDRLASAHVGLSLDLPGPEPELGSRTRLLFFVHMGLRPVSTAICALSQEMVTAGELEAVPPQSPEGLAAVLCRLADTHHDPSDVTRAQARLATTYAPDVVTAPLQAWAAAPVRKRGVDMPAAALAAELALGRDELARIHSSPTWKTLSRLHRFVRWD